ncbi:ubiquitin carboxyl-terminal hydrolase 31-like [Mya arenaria]|uniref:ubiquitin carboxyl-terminal hydrolase 31-like n=1 Tax=Mya arenaria TaxID=6604 RepID=UPI0022E778CD|nr:ubiquitin carboxyl-terminal hydrolase 31-like [Mya arenaria]
MYKRSANEQVWNGVEADLKGGLTPTSPQKQEISNLRSESCHQYVLNRKSHEYPSSMPVSSQSHMTQQALLPKWKTTPGAIGIFNHGNTCFMNTILQCLSNADVFSEYFVQRKYKDVFNNKGLKKLVGNVKGEVSDQLGNLLESLWSGAYTAEVSGNFKSIVSKYNAQYKGAAQHDAQEFLLWLLDRVNEEIHQSGKKKAKDLPAKSKKEKIETSIQSNNPEAVLTAACGFEIFNRFQALYQSSLTCPNCKKFSNTYESYLCLSIPVPQKSTRPVFATVVYLDDNPKQLKIAVEMNVMDTVMDLREKLAHELYVTPKRLVLCQLSDAGFGNTFGDDQPLTDIHESENVYVFETHPFSDINKTPEGDLIQILLVHVEKTSKRCYRFGNPEVIKVYRDYDFFTLQRCILKSMGMAVAEEWIEKSNHFERAIFDIRVVESGPSDCYLATNVEMPLYTQDIDRAMATYREDYGSSHVKFVVEWDTATKQRIVDNDKDVVDEHSSVHKARLSLTQPSSVSLDDCLRLFTKEEKLGEGDAWNCPYCGKVQDGAIKKLGLWSTPDILVIHLKRFRHCGLRKNKVNVLVNFPHDLDMTPHLLLETPGCHDDDVTNQYDLYAVSNHYGNMSGGHYTAYCKNPVNMQWYEFDDTTVQPLQSNEIISKAAYLLFYQRKQLTNNTHDNLLSNSHWVFSVNEPPLSVATSKSSVSEGKKVTQNSSFEGRKGAYSSNEVWNGERVQDYSDLLVNKVKLSENEKRDGAVSHVRSKSEAPLDRHSQVLLNEEASLIEELRREITPRKEKQYQDAEYYNRDSSDRWEMNSPRGHNSQRDITSPKREGMGINSPRQQPKHDTHESPKKELFPNQTPLSQNYNGDISPRITDRQRTSVVEQIIKSKNVTDKSGTLRPPPKIPPREHYRRSDSVDSSKNSHSFTSGSDGSAPPSPLDNSPTAYQPSQMAYQKVSSARPLQSNVLNNERENAIMNGTVPNNVKLKVYANPINKPSIASKPTGAKLKGSETVNSRSVNQKVTNAVAQSVNRSPDSPPYRTDMFATPQQVRKSPSPPVPARNYSTPQPVRKSYPESARSTRDPVERQYSVPSRQNTGDYDDYDGHNIGLQVQGQGLLDNQPISLPNEQLNTKSMADKPPLPRGSNPSRPVTAVASVSQEYKGQRRPTSAVGSSSRGQSSSSRPLNVQESRGERSSGSESESRRSRGRQEVRSRERHEVKMRNRSAERQSDVARRSVRSRPERPLSYHHSTHPEMIDDYYLSQPIDDEPTNFERTSYYATIRQPRADTGYLSSTDYLVDGRSDHSRYQLQQPSNIVTTTAQQPRSRAPIGYNPALYQDRGYDLPRYQPHLHMERSLQRLALKEKEMHRHKVKAECLKESSV